MKLIDKDALVAEIERLHKAHSGKYGCDEVGLNLEYLEDFINTIEVKEVDLKKILCEYFEGWRVNYYSEIEELLKPNGCTVDIDDVKEIARHFFELGLKIAQNNN